MNRLFFILLTSLLLVSCGEKTETDKINDLISKHVKKSFKPEVAKSYKPISTLPHDSVFERDSKFIEERGKIIAKYKPLLSANIEPEAKAKLMRLQEEELNTVRGKFLGILYEHKYTTKHKDVVEEKSLFVFPNDDLTDLKIYLGELGYELNKENRRSSIYRVRIATGDLRIFRNNDYEGEFITIPAVK